MSAPLSAHIWDVNTPEARRYREIENHYALQRTEANTQQMVQFQAANLAMQAQIADQQHHDMMEMSWGLDNLNEGIAGVQQELEGVRAGVDRVAQGVAATNQAVLALHDLLRQCMMHVSQQLRQQQETMEQIADILRRPLETQVLELRNHADHAIRSGVTSEGSRRAQWFEDGLELLRETTANPVGKQDYVAWFQTGWLLWKSGAELAEAEAAFDRAARLAGPARDLFLWESLRHLAYIRYLQGNLTGAWEAIGEALRAESNPRTLFDGARYAAVNNRPDDAIAMLEQGIRLEPTMIVEMLSEPDLNSLADRLAALVAKLTAEARVEAAAALAAWAQTWDTVERAAVASDNEAVKPSDPGFVQFRDLQPQVATASYLRCLEITAHARFTSGRLHRDARAGTDYWLVSSNLNKATAAAKLAEARATAARDKAAASSARDGAVNNANSRLKYDPSNPPYSLGFGLGCFGQIVCLIIILSVKQLSPTWDLIIGIPALVGTLIPVALMLVWKAIYVTHYRAGVRAERAEAEALHQEKLAATEARLEGELGPLTKELAARTAMVERATRALAILDEEA